MTVRTSLRIGTSENAAAAGMPCQRAIARGPDGVLYAVFPDAVDGMLQLMRSADGGESWEQAWQSERLLPVTNASLTVDERGMADLVLKAEAGYLYYRKGRPHQGGFSWSVRVRIYDVPELDHVNAVAHAEDDLTKVHVVFSKGGEWDVGYYVDFRIDPTLDASEGLGHSDREIWMGTRERIVGPFADGSGHPAPCLDLDRADKTLYAAVSGGSQGVFTTQARYFSGRWKWLLEPLVLDGRANAVAGSHSAVRLHDRFLVSYGAEPGVLHVRTTAGVDGDHSVEVGGGRVVRTSAGVDDAGRVHVLYQCEGDAALYARVLDVSDGSWSDADRVHDGPVTSFSCEQHGGGDDVVALVCAGAAAPYTVDVITG